MNKYIKYSFYTFLFVLLTFVFNINKINAETIDIYTINGSNVNFRTGAGTDFPKVMESFQFNNGDIVTYIGEQLDSANALWYNVSYNYGGTVYSGFVFGTFVTKTTFDIIDDGDFDAYLISQGFPQSYWPKLKELKALYPNWTFQAVQTGISWSNVVSSQSVTGKSLVHGSRDVSQRSTAVGAYDWNTDIWKALDSNVWFAANSQTVGYYLDPRNFLNVSNIFMFESLSYVSNVHTKAVVQGVLNNTFMSGTYPLGSGTKSYADTFIDAAKASKVSPVHLAARVRQEQGVNGTSKAISGAHISCWSNRYSVQHNRSGIYNFFNFGATSGTDPVCNGLVYANGANEGATTWGRPWTDRSKSILGGASQLGSSYITRGQDTLYFQKFNVSPYSDFPLHTHQYMTNIEAPRSESLSTYSAYNSFNALNSAFVFKIPVYNSMPASTSLPTLLGNPNNYLKAFTINGSSVPGFSRTKQSYSINVPSSVNSLSIGATRISSTASVSGTGTIALTSNEQQINVVVTAQNGTKRTYTITVTRGDGLPLTNDEILMSLKLTTSNSLLSGIKLNTTVNSMISSISNLNYLVTTTIKDRNNNAKASGNLATGDQITITNGDEELTYTAVIYGDANGDGKIDIRDLLTVQKTILKETNLTGAFARAADTTRTGNVTIRDLLAVQKHILGYSQINQ